MLQQGLKIVIKNMGLNFFFHSTLYNDLNLIV